jgi:6-phosphogluconate dehydrogenase (decarboxylating)
MQLGMIGLGRMGANMVKRLLRGGHQCVVFDTNLTAVQALVNEGAVGTASLDEFVARLTPPRAAWVMTPAAVVDRTLGDLLADIAEVWRRGSMVASWLLDLTALALSRSPDLANFSGRVSDSGEGRWTVTAAIEEGCPSPVLSAALYQRFSSRGEGDFAEKIRVFSIITE